MNKPLTAAAQASKRYSHIDLIEALAIFFVLVYHSTLYSFDFRTDGSLVNYGSYFFRTILSTCVPLFFFANGYLLFNRSFDLKKHIRKTLRLIVLVFVWAVVVGLITHTLLSDEPFSIKEMLLSILKLEIADGLNFLWYLGALVCIYILFPALKSLFDSNKKAFILFTAACAVLTFGFKFVNQALAFTDVLLPQSFRTISYPLLTMFNPFRGSYGYSFVYFCVGGLLYSYEDKLLAISKTKRNVLASFGLLISCGLLFGVGVFNTRFVDTVVWDVVWSGYDTIFTFFNVIFIYVLSLNSVNDHRFIKTVSCNTLGIYFLHGLLIRSTKSWIIAFGFLRNVPVNLIYAFAILCCSLVICLIMKRIPLLRKLI